MRSRLPQMLWGLCLLIAVTGSGQAAVFQTTLDNGLTVLIEENHANPVVAVEVFVRTGSIYEQEYLGSGISHFFEHIIHGGTTSTRSEAASSRLLEAIGNNSNAYTTVDHTAYYINTTTEHWRTAVELLADWMLHSSIMPEEFERERESCSASLSKVSIILSRCWHKSLWKPAFRCIRHAIRSLGIKS